MSDPTKFGITLVLPDYAFAAELHRDSIDQMLREIDERLTDEGAPDEPEARCEAMLENALAISTMVANREVDHMEAVSDIAYSFVYAFGTVVGFDQVKLLRGLTGTYLRNRLNFNPCLGDAEYEMETSMLQRRMDDDDFDFEIPPPTVH